MAATEQATTEQATTEQATTEQATAEQATAEQATAEQGLGVGMGLALVGPLLLLVPLVLPLSGAWLTALYVLAIIVAGIGVAGALTELSKIRNRPELLDIGVAVALLAVAAGFLIVRVSHDFPYPVLVVLAVLIFLLAGFGVIGVFMGVSKALGGAASNVPAGTSPSVGGRPAEHERLAKKDWLTLGVTLFCGLLAGVTTIIAAYISKG